jgi:hypothetical protein
MKKVHFVFISMFILSLVAAIVLRPTSSASQKNFSQTTVSIPDSVATILKNSCSGCHGDAGSGMAKSMWNFNAWDTYSAAKQAKKANAICDALTKAIMPPSSFKNANPGKVPTAIQTASICKWAGSLKAK